MIVSEAAIVRLAEQPVLAVRTRTGVAGLPEQIGKNYMKIAGYMATKGLMPKEAPYTAYFNMDMDDLDVEMGFPVPSPVEGNDEVKAGSIPACDAAVCTYKGPYSGMKEAYDALTAHIAAQGRVPSGAAYEFYFNSPQEVAESELLTKIVMPLVPR